MTISLLTKCDNNYATLQLAFQLSDSDEVITLIAGTLSHQTIRMLSAQIEGIAAYKGLDIVVENNYYDSNGMYQVLAESALT